MWVLESEGDAFQGRKLWLRPGKKFLFGRTVSEPGAFAVSDKTISRRHLTVEVSAVEPIDCGNSQSRSKITLEDINTKIGTLVNGEQIRGKRLVLELDQNVITLGKYKHHITFTWVPVTFTFSFTAKEAKADPYTALYKLLGPLDIKVLVNYERGNTTHVVAKKRNTSKGLQALIDGKYIVHNDSFIKAIVAATTAIPPTEENCVAQSPLEQDWENLPDPLKYLPPRGDEPTQRDSIAYAPNLDRQDIFEGYIFIFYDKRQFETLLAPITEGRGKALHREVLPGETDVGDFVGYVKSVAGEKGLGEFEDGSEGKGVVVVRFNPVKGASSEWFSGFNRQVSLFLDHRLIEQNEFLDAILGNDASVLRRPLEIEPSGVVAPPSTTNTAMASQTQTLRQAPTATEAQVSPPETVSQPARRGRSRRTFITKFKGFHSDDEETPPPMDYDQQDEEDIMDQMAPTATTLKRRKLADDDARRRRGESTPPPPLPKEEPPVPKAQPAKKAKKEMDVVEIVRKQREQAEKLAREEREALQEDLDGMDIEAIRNLAIVEEMEVIRPPPPQRAPRADESDRWDDRWNGRKNFKKFRRRGAEGGRRELGRVIVPLEEAKKKDYGIGDDYWLEGDGHSKKIKGKGKGKGKGRDAQDINQAESQPSRPKNKASTRAAEILAKEVDEALLDEEMLADAPHPSSDIEIVEPPPSPPPPKLAASSRSQKFQKLVDKTNSSQNLSPKKRVAETTLTKPAPAKKARSAAIEVHDSDDDSDDEFKFKFRKRV